MAALQNDNRPGESSEFACPDCGGVLWEIDQDGFIRYRCRVGHAFTASYLQAEQRHSIETALWSALRALEESAALHRRMQAKANKAHLSRPAQLYGERAHDDDVNSKAIRDLLLRVNALEQREEREERKEIA